MRLIEVTSTPAPPPVHLAYMAGVIGPLVAAMLTRWRVYPAVLALAMLWPTVSSASRCACSADRATLMLPNAMSERLVHEPGPARCAAGGDAGGGIDLGVVVAQP